MKKLNFPLIVGSAVLTLLLMLSYFPEYFTSRDPLHEEPPRYIEYLKEGDLVEELSLNPMRPNSINLMGTDDAGRDIYARLVYGTRNTLRLGFLIALFRMLIALPVGILAGMGKKQIITVAIELAFQNSGLSTGLAKAHFPSLAQATVPGALYSVWQNLAGSILAYLFRRWV